MQRHSDVVTDQFGNAVQGAAIAVLDSSGNLATLYADNNLAPAALINPLTTDANGTFSFYAGNGRYTLTVTGTGLPTRTVSDVILADPDDQLTTADLLNDWVASGLLPSDPGAVLAMTTPTGVAYILGKRVTPIATGHTYTASKDTYVDLSSLGAYTYSEVTNGASAPAVAASSMRLFKVVTNGTEITGVTDLRALTVTLKSPVLPVLPAYAKAALPSAATYARGMIYVTNDVGGAVPAFSDGAAWRRVTDRAVVS